MSRHLSTQKIHPNPCMRFWVILPTDRQTLQAIAYTYSFVGGKLVSDKQLGHSLLVTQYTCVLCQSHAVCRPIDDEEKGERSNTVNILKADIDKCKSSLLSQNIGTKLPSCHVSTMIWHHSGLKKILSRVSILTREIDIPNLSVCLFVHNVPVLDDNDLTYCRSFFTVH